MKNQKIIASITILFCFAWSGVSAQSIGKSVVASNGGSFSGSGILVDWTTGQSVINYATPSTLQVTEGFLPIVDTTGGGPTATPFIHNPLLVKAYPNPVNNLLNVTVQQNTVEPVNIQVTDLMGQTVETIALPAQLNTETNVDFSALATGTYYLIINENKDNAQFMKIVKY